MHKLFLLGSALFCALLSNAQFIENKGQVVDLNQNFQPEVEYYAGVGNASVFFEKDRIVFNFREKDEFDFSNPPFRDNKDLRDSVKATLGSTFHRIDLQLIGSSSEAKIEGESKTSHYTNFFLNKREDIQNVQSYNEIRYTEVYPNIDLLFHFTSKGLKYDFILKEGADINDIKFRYEGADKVSIDSDGKLNIKTNFDEIKEDIPLSFLDDDKSRVTDVTYELFKDNVIGFSLEKDITFSQLTIDPFLTWATYFEGPVGDNELDYYSSIADDLGNYFLEGWINNAANDYPTVDPGGSAYFQNYVSNNLYIAKFDPNRNLVWATYYGGSTSIDWSTATDPLAISGTTLHFVGSQLSSDAPLVNGGGYYYGAPSSDPYWLRINKNTGALLHATAFPSHTSSQPSIATSNSGLVAIIQQTYDFGNPEILFRPGAYNQAVNGDYQDMHIMLFNSSNNLIWGTFLGGPNTTDNFHVTFDNNDNIFFVGEANNTFSPNATNTHLQSFPGSYYQSTYSAAMGNHDLIIGKFNSSGALVWHTLYGGDASDGLKSQMGNGSRVIIDPVTQDLLVIGGTNSSNFPIQTLAGAYNQTTPPLNTDPSSGSFSDFNSFIIKFNNDGALNWSTYWGDDPSGDLLYDGVFTGCEKFIVSSRSFSHTTLPQASGYNQATGGQGFLMQFDDNFSAEWSSYVSSDMGEPTIAHSSLDNRLYIGGSTFSESITTLDPGNGAYYDDINDDPDAGTTSPSFLIYELDLNPQVTGTNTACVGQTISLTGSGTPAGSIPWVSSNTGVATVNSSGDVTGQSAGTATITYTDNAGCSANFSITIGAVPTANASAVSATLCEGDDIELTGNTVGGANYSWTGPNGFTSTSEDPTITNAVSGDAGTYSLVITSGGCSSASDDVTITVNNNPNANAGVVSNTVCAGDDIELTSNTVGGATYSWTGPNGFTSSNEDPTISGATTGADGTYSLTITNNGCISATDNVSVTVNASPTANAGVTNATICSGDNIELTGNTIGGATYSWTGPNGFTSSNEDPTISGATVAASGTYSLTITDNGCSSIVDNVSVTVNANPSANAGVVNNTICTGQNIQLTGNTVSGASYSWTGPNGFTSSNEDPTITGATTAASGTYSLTITNNGCTSVTDNVSVTVNPTPTANAGAVSTTICEGDNIELTGNTISGATYSWTGPNGFTSSNEDPTILGATSAESGTYTLIITQGSCSSASDNVSISIDPLPSAIAGVINGNLCEGDDIELTGNTVSGATYSWTGPNGFTSSDEDPIISGVTTGDDGTYSLVISIGSCSSTNSDINVTVNGLPSLSASGTDISCFGENDGEATVSATGNGPFDYSWSPSGGTSVTASGLAQDTYTVTVTDNNNCESTEVVTINEPTEIVLTTSTTSSQCTVEDGSATVSAVGGTGNYTYEWNDASNQTTAVATGLGAGSYEITVTDDSGCSVTETVNVSSVNGPTVSIINVTDVSCPGESSGSAEADVTGGTAPYTYNWSPGGQSSAIANNLSAGNYTIEVTDDAGCLGTANITIDAPAPFDVSATVNDADCGQNNGDIIVTASGSNGNLTYDWTPVSGSSSSLLNISGGTYTLTITDDQACTFDTSFVVNATGGLSAVITPDSVTIDQGDLVNISTTVDPNVSGETYSWSPSDGLSCNDCPNPIANPEESTTYIVTIQTADGCSETDSVQIIVDDPCGKVFVPNMFSPNNDGKNDELCVYGGCLTSFEINIYNRWGEVVYRSNDPEMCWNGTYKNERLNTSVFAYKLTYVDQNGEEQSESGNLQLIR